MSQQFDPDDPEAMDSWIRDFYKIKNEPTDAFLIRNGVTADTLQGFVKRTNMALAWLWPHLTPRIRLLYDEIRSIVDEVEAEIDSMLQFFDEKSSPKPRPARKFYREAPTDEERAKFDKARLLFEQAKILCRLESAQAEQNVFRQAQSARASKPRKLSEASCARIAKRYWESKQNGESYGIVKQLAAEYDVTPTTIHATVKKYKPHSIDK
jgi:hypothetical protein